MSALTEAQKEGFLELIADGYDRGCAAKQIGATGTQFKRLCNPSSKTYDEEFAIRYEMLVAERGAATKHCHEDANQPREKTEQGYTKAAFLTDEDKEEFLMRVRDGIPRDLAARIIGTSLYQINRAAAREPEFASALREAYEVGHPIFTDRLRSKAFEMAMTGNYNALRDMLIVNAEEYGVLRTQRHEVGGIDGGAIKILAAHLPNMPADVLDRLIELAEQQELQQPAEPRQLPRKVA